MVCKAFSSKFVHSFGMHNSAYTFSGGDQGLNNQTLLHFRLLKKYIHILQQIFVIQKEDSLHVFGITVDRYSSRTFLAIWK